jgi:hypothetical protein
MTGRAESVDAFLQAVAARLPGPTKPRAEILAELRDGLLEAVADDERAGVGHDEAVQRALRRFGDPPALAQAFWPELAAARARRSALALFATARIVAALWIAAARERGINQGGHLFDSSLAHAAAALLIAAAISAGALTLLTTGPLRGFTSLQPHRCSALQQ